MKVIKKGIKKGKKSKPGPWSQLFVCTSCSAVLEVVEKDLYVVNLASELSGTWNPELRFDCKDCDLINNATDKVPEDIQAKKYKRAQARHQSW
jgi:hypothetical protein